MLGRARPARNSPAMPLMRSSKRKHSKSIPRATFKRLVHEICQDVALSTSPHKWSESAIDALHEDAENYLAEHFQKANFMRLSLMKQTLDRKHLHTALAFSGSQVCAPFFSCHSA